MRVMCTVHTAVLICVSVCLCVYVQDLERLLESRLSTGDLTFNAVQQYSRVPGNTCAAALNSSLALH